MMPPASVLAAINPHVDGVSAIVADGDLAIIFANMYLSIPLIERLRGDNGGPLVRVSRERIAQSLEPGDPDELRAYLTRPGIERVLVVAGKVYSCISIERPPRGLTR